MILPHSKALTMATIKPENLSSTEHNKNLVHFFFIFSCFKISKLVSKHAAFISLERNNIPLAKFLGQAHVCFGMGQKLEKNNRYHLGRGNHSQFVTNPSRKGLVWKRIFQTVY